MECGNCISLTQQCLELKDEISKLNQKLDNLLDSVLRNKLDFSCQSSPSLNSKYTQTEINEVDIIPASCFNQLASTTQTDNAIELSENLANTSTYSCAGYQFYESIVESETYVVPLVKLPYIHLSNQPFSSFDVNTLDKDSAFDIKLHNRSMCYYGDSNYSYNNIVHQSRPIPSSNNYLCKILEHLHTVIPDIQYNSILLTKYMNGSQYIDFHSDDEPEIEPTSDIITISLGETRQAKFRGINVNDSYPEQSLTVGHGDVFIMSRDSQNFFQHSISADSSQEIRISITLRLLRSNTTNTRNLPVSSSVVAPALAAFGPSSDNNIRIPNATAKYTLYIGDSMLRHLDSKKMSSSTQEALVYYYPGATVAGVLTKLKNDPAFQCIDPKEVGKIFVFCGANNVDKALNIPFNNNSDFITLEMYRASENAIVIANSEFTELANFLFEWATSASINFVNILPRVSLVRNHIINGLNYHIEQLSLKYAYINFVSTELNRNLFSFQSGHRKNTFFSNNGDDNVHLNFQGIARLAKHLKYFAHN